jgi:hypothetical protein
METSINFRKIRCCLTAPKTLCHLNYPIPGNKQEHEISLLANNTRIATVLNLSYTKFKLKRKIIFVPWFSRLYQRGSVIALVYPTVFE